jgi:hypothetical protein
MSESAFPFDVLGPIHGYRIWRVLEHGLMTYSPMEIHPWSFDRFTAGMVAVTTSGYNPLYILSGLVMGPLFGLLGQRWCLRRSWVSAALVAGALCLEPLARWAAGQLRGDSPRVDGRGRVGGRRCRTFHFHADRSEALGVSVTSTRPRACGCATRRGGSPSLR